MLQSLRDNTKGVVAGILIGLLVIIFALSGAEALFTGGGSPNTVVTVNGEDITEQEVSRQVNMERRQLLSRFGDSVPDEFLSDERLRPAAIDTLIQRSVLVQEARSKGMAISPETLDSMIVATEEFRGPDGRFDANRYQQLLRSAGFTPSTYRRALEEEMLINQLANGISGSGFVTPAELEHLIALSYQTRDFQYVTLNAERVADEVSITDEEIIEYYENNQAEFTQEEQVAVDYVELSVERLMDDIDIPESELRAQFKQNMAAAEREGVQRRAAHILIEDGDEERLETVASRLAAGEDFAEVARETSDDFGTRNQGGDLGFIEQGEFPEAFEDRLAALSVGEVSEPVETEYGVHFIKLMDERRSDPVQFEDQRDEIARQLKRVQAENQFVTMMTRLSEVSFNAEDLAEVEEELGLPVQNTGLFGRSGGEGIAANRQVIQAAFSEEVLEHGNPSDVLELSPSRVVVVKKTDRQEAFVRPLDDVREQIATYLEEEETRRLLTERGEQVEEALQRGEPVDAVAERWNLDVQEVQGISRDEADLPRQLVNHAFAMPRPTTDEPVVGGVHVGLDYHVVVLANVDPGTLEALSAEERDAMAQNLRRMFGQQDYAAYQDMLQERADIRRR
ncbi:SurA N-terminal domain-containing protein [Marinimicrobium sp. ABcell2]|uniref:SurA N-terminal domain-containing protein n=1 Tax=Marinimicrobium sp. ABcell2 TaxID=3069751 RepID=UPI0027B698D0|nr:SurA N-terminal domain-containing protein [Marinimicrobium sp. ABcell2]MDQ2075702.1 SurA N-terminal domain-containing protein [Marinimicrobium sp. ABcell2]